MMINRRLKVTAFKCIRTLGRAVYKRKIWLVSDRAAIAGDNGEAFFRFLSKKDVDAVFAIKKNSPDYERIRRYGKVVEYESLRYKFLLCICECHVSSQVIHMDNHEEAPQIFLQHGVIHSDCSKLLNPVSHRNFYVLASGLREKENLCGDNYVINPENVWLTGLPRFDLLKDDPSQKIVIAFTWRANLQNISHDKVEESLYVKTLLRILNDTKLNDLLTKSGYKMYFKLHPEMSFLVDVLPQEVAVRIYKGSYNELFKEVSILITDYSSTVYDLAYLKKPVLYYQFDSGEYFDNPFTSKGNCDYERDGFGPVTYTYEEFKKELIRIIDNKCVMEEKYKNRADDFFAFIDKQNCERVYQNIKRIVE